MNPHNGVWEKETGQRERGEKWTHLTVREDRKTMEKNKDKKFGLGVGINWETITIFLYIKKVDQEWEKNG